MGKFTGKWSCFFNEWVFFNKDGSELLSYPLGKNDTSHTVSDYVKPILLMIFLFQSELLHNDNLYGRKKRWGRPTLIGTQK